jgi:hypothetical protein
MRTPRVISPSGDQPTSGPREKRKLGNGMATGRQAEERQTAERHGCGTAGCGTAWLRNSMAAVRQAAEWQAAERHGCGTAWLRNSILAASSTWTQPEARTEGRPERKAACRRSSKRWRAWLGDLQAAKPSGSILPAVYGHSCPRIAVGKIWASPEPSRATSG